MFKAVSDTYVYVYPSIPPPTFPLVNVFCVLKKENTENRMFALFIKFELSKTRKQNKTKQKTLEETLEES